MRIRCPICGLRDRREFTCKGSDAYLDRPDGDWSASWHNYLHLRENPAGPSRDLWHHHAGCGAWLVVERDTVTHRIGDVVLAREVR